MASQDKGHFSRRPGQRNQVSQGNQSGGKSGQQSGENFANDLRRTSEAGHKGVEHSDGNRS